MNVRRVAALLRELADELEKPEPAKPRRRPLALVQGPAAKPEVLAKVQRGLRRAGIVT